MPYHHFALASEAIDNLAITWIVLIALGLIALAFIFGRIWQWFKDARSAMGARRNRR